jgi:hypothetical protein
MDKFTYLNNKINQSKINSNGKGQEEIKDGWFNTEICKKENGNSVSNAVLRTEVMQKKNKKRTMSVGSRCYFLSCLSKIFM